LKSRDDQDHCGEGAPTLELDVALTVLECPGGAPRQAGGIRRSPTAALHEPDDFLSLQILVSADGHPRDLPRGNDRL
jgi:hypothetical protein